MAPLLPLTTMESTLSLLSSPSSPPAVKILSKQTVRPHTGTAMTNLPLSISDLPMLSCHYIQKGLFFTPPPIPIHSLLSLLISSLSHALSLIPPLAGRLVTLPDDRVVVSCNDEGVEFYHATAPSLSLPLLLPSGVDVPAGVMKEFFPMDRTVSYDGHFKPLTAFQITELGDGAVFIGCAANHAIVDGTSLWNFFNSWAELCRGGKPKPPDFHRNFFGDSKAVLRFPGGVAPKVTFDADAPLRERVFHFSAGAIRELKAIANRRAKKVVMTNQDEEIYGKLAHDPKAAVVANDDVSSFQSLCAQFWRSVTRARKTLAPDTTTTFRMAINCRHRLVPPISPDYFGNAIQSLAATATVQELAANDLKWAGKRLHASVAGYGNEAVRKKAAEWQAAPRCFPLGNPDGAVITMGSSNRFPMYDGNDFGWGRPVAVRSGRANKYDGKFSAFPGQAGDGSVDIEVCLAPETMAELIRDEEFMQYAS